MTYIKRFILTAFIFISGCGGVNPHPHLMMLPKHKKIVLERINREPYITLLERVKETANREPRQGPPDVYPYSEEKYNADIAQASAFLAYIFDDWNYAQKALEILKNMRTDFENNRRWDVHIVVSFIVFRYINAYDLLMGTGLYKKELKAIREKLILLVRKFYHTYVKGFMSILMLPTQNNYNLHTAVAVGYPALAFPDVPENGDWMSIAFSEINFILNEDTGYIQKDGGISEGPHYFNFAMETAIPLLIAYHNTFGEKTLNLRKSCIFRINLSPWDNITCIQGEVFEYKNPLQSQKLKNAMDWTVRIRLPSGDRPPIDDSPFTYTNSAGIFTHFSGEGYYAWDWYNNEYQPMQTFEDEYYLIYFDDSVEPSPPEWSLNQFLPYSGNVVFRSSWDKDAVWFMLMAENGTARKTVHDHVDGTSFQMYAFGEYLAIDTGYYKPNPLDNALTSGGESHNLVLVDGKGPPEKGYLTDFGDVDSFLRETYDGDNFAFARVETSFRGVEVNRLALFVRKRYVVIGDILYSSENHSYTFRLHGNAGYTSGGRYYDTADGGVWEREKAGLQFLITGTGNNLSLSHPPYSEGNPPYAHLFDHDRTARDHQVLDATIEGKDEAFLSILYPYRVSSEVKQLSVKEKITSADFTAIEYILPDGSIDIAMININYPSPATINFSDGTSIETDGLFAFAGHVQKDPQVFIFKGNFIKLNSQNIPLQSDPSSNVKYNLP